MRVTNYDTAVWGGVRLQAGAGVETVWVPPPAPNPDPCGYQWISCLPPSASQELARQWAGLPVYIKNISSPQILVEVW